jgi:hypothetical protein
MSSFVQISLVKDAPWSNTTWCVIDAVDIALVQCTYAVLAAMPMVGSPGVVVVVPVVVPLAVVVLVGVGAEAVGVVAVGAVGVVGEAAVGEAAVGTAALLLFVLVGGSATTTVGRRLTAVGGETGAGMGNAAVMGAPTDAADADAVVLLLRSDKVTGTAMAANITTKAIAAITAYVVVHLVALRGTAAFDEGVDNGVEGGGGDEPFSLFDDNKVKSSASSSSLLG